MNPNIYHVISFLRAYFRGAQSYSTTKLTGKTAIVTGASSGIGEQIALDFAQRGRYRISPRLGLEVWILLLFLSFLMSKRGCHQVKA